MKKQLFDELVESIKEAGQIHRGENPPSREFVSERVRTNRKKFHKTQSEFARKSKDTGPR